MGRVGGWPRLTFFFLLDGVHRGEDSTVAIHRTVNKRGCPTRRVYAWGFISYRHNRFRQRIKTATNQIKSPTRKPDAWATQFISSFGVRATRPSQLGREVPFVSRLFLYESTMIWRAAPKRAPIATPAMGGRVLANAALSIRMVIPPMPAQMRTRFQNGLMRLLRVIRSPFWNCQAGVPPRVQE
jgi:hypothetical protein